jgi:hypothetical protein
MEVPRPEVVSVLNPVAVGSSLMMLALRGPIEVLRDPAAPALETGDRATRFERPAVSDQQQRRHLHQCFGGDTNADTPTII